MNDDYPPSQKKNLLTRLKHLIQGEPQSKSELAAVIHEANRAVINEDTTEMIQGVWVSPAWKSGISWFLALKLWPSKKI